ncbi:MAG: hypothetical protein WCD54_10335 [Pseudolabrys sp.]
MASPLECYDKWLRSAFEGRVTRTHLSYSFAIVPAGGTRAANGKNEKFGTFSF